MYIWIFKVQTELARERFAEIYLEIVIENFSIGGSFQLRAL
jgi:hypothetical protein